MSSVEGRRAAHLAESESRLRQVNEAIDRGTAQVRRQASYVCECGQLGCTEVVDVGARAYEAVRTGFTRFLVVPGHATDLDRVVEEHDGYQVVEKVGDEPRSIARDTDPRSGGRG